MSYETFEIGARRPAAIVAIHHEEEAAYVVVQPHITREDWTQALTLLGEHGFELMEPDECEPEPTYDNGLRYWAARIDGGTE